MHLCLPRVVARGGPFLGAVAVVAPVCGLAGALLAETLLRFDALRQRFGSFWGQAGGALGCGLAMAASACRVGIEGMGTGKP